MKKCQNLVQFSLYLVIVLFIVYRLIQQLVMKLFRSFVLLFCFINYALINKL